MPASSKLQISQEGWVQFLVDLNLQIMRGLAHPTESWPWLVPSDEQVGEPLGDFRHPRYRITYNWGSAENRPRVRLVGRTDSVGVYLTLYVGEGNLPGERDGDPRIEASWSVYVDSLHTGAARVVAPPQSSEEQEVLLFSDHPLLEMSGGPLHPPLINHILTRINACLTPASAVAPS